MELGIVVVVEPGSEDIVATVDGFTVSSEGPERVCKDVPEMEEEASVEGEGEADTLDRVGCSVAPGAVVVDDGRFFSLGGGGMTKTFEMLTGEMGQLLPHMPKAGLPMHG